MNHHENARRAHLDRYYRREMQGYVYVIEFSTGMVKVGMAKNVAKRMAQHEKEARNHAATVARSWISDAHTTWEANERSLISFCSKRFGAPTSGSEYFMAADFDAIVGYAMTLTFPELTDEQVDGEVQERLETEMNRASSPEAQARRNRIADGLPADLAEAQALFDRLASMTDEEAAAMRHRAARQEWLDRKASRKQWREQWSAWVSYLRSLNAEDRAAAIEASPFLAPKELVDSPPAAAALGAAGG
jgi:hypothetical protein